MILSTVLLQINVIFLLSNKETLRKGTRKWTNRTSITNLIIKTTMVQRTAMLLKIPMVLVISSYPKVKFQIETLVRVFIYLFLLQMFRMITSRLQMCVAMRRDTLILRMKLKNRNSFSNLFKSLWQSILPPQKYVRFI